MKGNPKEMMKFSLNFCIWSLGLFGFVAYGAKYFYRPGTEDSYKIRDEREKISIDSSRFMKQWGEKKAEIKVLMKKEEEEMKKNLQSEELPELVQVVLDVLDGKIDENSAIDLTKS